MRSLRGSSSFFKSKKFYSVIALFVVVSLTGAPVTSIAATKVSAASTLSKLKVHAEASMSGYARKLFSDGWGSIGSCDTRNYILQRDLKNITWKSGASCEVATGVLHDPYTGKVINFVRGVGTSIKVHIDHVVPIANAWRMGAQSWNSYKRYSFYNDPLNLLAVDGPTNEAKSDSDASQWLPPRASYRCAYVARQIAVKYRYGVWVTRAEKSVMASVLHACPGYPLPKTIIY